MKCKIQPPEYRGTKSKTCETKKPVAFKLKQEQLLLIGTVSCCLTWRRNLGYGTTQKPVSKVTLYTTIQPLCKCFHKGNMSHSQASKYKLRSGFLAPINPHPQVMHSLFKLKQNLEQPFKLEMQIRKKAHSEAEKAKQEAFLEMQIKNDKTRFEQCLSV